MRSEGIPKSREIIEAMRIIATENMSGMGFFLPNKYFARDGLFKKPVIERLFQINPSLVRVYVGNSSSGLGLRELTDEELRAIKKNFREIITPKEVHPTTDSETKPPDTLLSQPDEIYTQLHFQPQKEINPLSDDELLSRERQIISFLQGYNHNEGMMIMKVEEWLLGELNNIIDKPLVFLADLIEPPQLSQKQQPIYVGIYSLSQFLLGDLELANAFMQTVSEMRTTSFEEVETVCEKYLSPSLTRILILLDQYDNPDELIIYNLNNLRNQLSKYFKQPSY